jgi:dimethylhistidine N-methyltransferase
MTSTIIGEYSISTENKKFYFDVIRGLTQQPKQLSSKYFYDKKGDSLFQAIMASPDYYLTNCEMEIFACQSDSIADYILGEASDFELVELGPGNCAKSIHLLKALAATNVSFNFVPIDISENVIRQLESFFPLKIPGLDFNGLIGDYFNMLEAHCSDNKKRKVVMCLGANIGNMTVAEGNRFCSTLRGYLQPGDQCIIGFDLIKHPAIIRQAYDDRGGLTREFNLNLLHRINRELNADFMVDQFEHYCSYDPLTGAAKSFLVCLKDMSVRFPGAEIFFEKDECIWTETSQKYSAKQIRHMAIENGFVHTTEFLDSKSWFMDAVWTAI